MDFPWSKKRSKDVNLPLEGSVIPESRRPKKPEELGREIGKGFRQLRELTKTSRSQSTSRSTSKGGR